MRPRRHSGGRRLVVTSSPRRRRILEGRGWFAYKIFPKVAEYRVHVVNRRILNVAQKIPSNPNAIAWNHSAGSVFKKVGWNSINRNMAWQCIKAMDLARLNFGALDVMVDKDGNLAICEINSAPAVDDYMASRYAEMLDWYIRAPRGPLNPKFDDILFGHR